MFLRKRSYNISIGNKGHSQSGSKILPKLITKWLKNMFEWFLRDIGQRELNINPDLSELINSDVLNQNFL